MKEETWFRVVSGGLVLIVTLIFLIFFFFPTLDLLRAAAGE